MAKKAKPKQRWFRVPPMDDPSQDLYGPVVGGICPAVEYEGEEVWLWVPCRMWKEYTHDEPGDPREAEDEIVVQFLVYPLTELEEVPDPCEEG